jgi:hypothetical protein
MASQDRDLLYLTDDIAPVSDVAVINTGVVAHQAAIITHST